MNELNNHETGNGESSKPMPRSESNGREKTVEQRFLDHFGLNEQPFGVTPDLRFLYLGPKHRQALAALNFGTELNRGFLTLIAEPGMGKTSLLLNYLEYLRDKARTVYMFQTPSNSHELMSYILTDLGFDGIGRDLPEMHAILNRILMKEMRSGRQVVLVIDEAQNLTGQVLESVRLLSNFETPWMKLMQIVLAGQHQLAARLAEPSMTQLLQRVSLSIQIEPLTPEEVIAYIDHRLWIAGYKGSPIFSRCAQKLIAEKSEGIPRKINNLCFCGMSLGWATKQKTVDREMILDVSTETSLAPLKASEKSLAKSNSPTKLIVNQPTRLPILTVKESHAPGRFAKVVLVCAVLLALVWSGAELHIARHFTFLWQHTSPGEKISIIPAQGSVILDPAASDSPVDSLPGPSSETPRGDRGFSPPGQSGGPSTLSSREPN
ncbi:MAG TPA: AAA family ATPase [Candidatus Acidoferrales bacterium]|jgi:general secretion pathway protein A